MPEDNEYIKFDIGKIIRLREDYILTMQQISESLPFNLNSRKDIMNFFEKTFNIQLQSTKINEIKSHLDKFSNNQDKYEIILAVTFYFKMKYTVKNYFDSILKHEEEGVVKLRKYFGNLAMPNRQALPLAPEIVECIIEGSKEVMNFINTESKKKWNGNSTQEGEKL